MGETGMESGGPRAEGRRPVAVVSATIPYSVVSFYLGLCRELGSRGYDVHVVTSPGSKVPEIEQVVDSVHVLPMRRGMAPAADLVALVRWLLLMRSLRPRVVLAGTPKAALLAMLSARAWRAPRRTYHVLGLRGETARGWRARLLAGMEWLTAWCSTTVLAVSPSLADELTRRRLTAGRAVQVLGSGSTHGVDAEHFTPRPPDPEVARRLGIDLDEPVIAFVGRLTRDKGVETLIGMLDEVRRAEGGAQLVVVGAQDEDDSDGFVAQLSALRGVVLVDDQDDVRPFMALADVLVLPTLREGMPNVVLEAAAMGIPSVTTTATGAVDSVVDGRTGYAVAVGDGDAMAERVLGLLRRPEERARLGEAARQRAVVEFLPARVHQRIADVITGR